MRIWKKPIDMMSLTNLTKNSMPAFLEIEFLEFGDDFITARMPVSDKTRQPIGIMHGGASCVLAETVGSVSAYFASDLDCYCVGLDINTNHIRAIREGFVMGTAKPFHIGSSTQVWGINIIDENQKLISVTRLTMAVLKHK